MEEESSIDDISSQLHTVKYLRSSDDPLTDIENDYKIKPRRSKVMPNLIEVCDYQMIYHENNQFLVQIQSNQKPDGC